MRARLFGIYLNPLFAVAGRLSVSTPKMEGLSIYRWAMLDCGNNQGAPYPYQFEFGYSAAPVNEVNVPKVTPRPFTRIMEPSGMDLANYGGTFNEGMIAHRFGVFGEPGHPFKLNYPVFAGDSHLVVSISPSGAISSDVARTRGYIHGIICAVDQVPETVLACFHRWGFNA